MRKLYLTLLMATFGLMIFCVGASFPIVPHDGTQSDPALLYASDTVAIVFDDVYSPENIDIVKIDVEVVRQGAVVATWEFTDNIVIAGAVVRVGIRAEAAALDNGSYVIRARVWDSFGNVSDWSDDLWASKQWRTVPKPGGCKVFP